MAGRSPLWELTSARTKEFFRQPEAVFWVYIFPILLMAGLGVAFRKGGAQDLRIAVTDAARCAELSRMLPGDDVRFEHLSGEEALMRYSAGRIDLIVESSEGRYRYVYDPTRSGAHTARLRVNDALQGLAGRKDPIPSEDVLIAEPGSRYIDWLIPGLVGMNIMGGGLWGLGFVTVEIRMRKLLKRFAATPMRRSDFLLALMVSRLFFLVTEIAVILVMGHLLFGLAVRGSVLSLAFMTLLGGICFSGLGLLLACRTDKIETISGLINVVLLPMWLLSGIFFSSERFPDSMQPFVQALPLTQLNNALRKIILEGAPLESQWLPAGVLILYGVASFALALRWFRWQ
jgi:ABC-type multidrug transport system permease subunit